MADSVRRVSYMYAMVDDRPGEGARVLAALKQAGADLLALHAFPSDGKAQLDFFPKDPGRLTQAAKDANLSLSAEKTAFLIEGKDRLGAMHEVLDKLSQAGLNVIATDAVATGGRYAAILWVDQNDADKAADALGAH